MTLTRIALTLLILACLSGCDHPKMPVAKVAEKPAFDSIQDLYVEHIPTDRQRDSAVAEMKRRYPPTDDSVWFYLLVRKSYKRKSTYTSTYGHMESWRDDWVSPRRSLVIVSRGSKFCYAFPFLSPGQSRHYFGENGLYKILESEFNALFQKLCNAKTRDRLQSQINIADSIGFAGRMVDQIFETMDYEKVNLADSGHVLEVARLYNSQSFNPSSKIIGLQRAKGVTKDLVKDNYLVYTPADFPRGYYFEVIIPANANDNFKVLFVNCCPECVLY